MYHQSTNIPKLPLLPHQQPQNRFAMLGNEIARKRANPRNLFEEDLNDLGPRDNRFQKEIIRIKGQKYALVDAIIRLRRKEQMFDNRLRDGQIIFKQMLITHKQMNRMPIQQQTHIMSQQLMRMEEFFSIMMKETKRQINSENSANSNNCAICDTEIAGDDTQLPIDKYHFGHKYCVRSYSGPCPVCGHPQLADG